MRMVFHKNHLLPVYPVSFTYSIKPPNLASEVFFQGLIVQFKDEKYASEWAIMKKILEEGWAA